MLTLESTPPWGFAWCVEKRAIFQVLVLIFAALVSVGIYAWWTERAPDRYNWFDFFRGEPIPEAPANNPPAPVPAPNPAAANPTAALDPAPIGMSESFAAIAINAVEANSQGARRFRAERF